MTESENFIKSKTEEIEKLIAGLWMAKNNETWTFYSIEADKRVGNLLIAGTGNPVPGRFMGYEVIWVNENSIFIDLVWLSIAFRTQHQIWISEHSLKIAFINANHQKQQTFYIELVKA